ncbi:hypothetical protein GCM10023325_08600 [Sphingomonas lutea]
MSGQRPRKSLRDSIDAMCRECCARDAGSNWREHVAVCSCSSCPLWPVRPLCANASAWMKTRDPANAPREWFAMSRETALAQMRNIHTDAPGRGKTAILGHCEEPKVAVCFPVTTVRQDRDVGYVEGTLATDEQRKRRGEA